MKKFILSCFLSALCLTAAFAVDYSGTCGVNLTWEFDPSTSVLTISGTGAMDDYDYNNSQNYAPWYSIYDIVNKIVVQQGVTTIGAYAFYGLKNAQEVVLPNSLVQIGQYAFMYVKIQNISLGNNITNIGDYAFTYCDKLTDIVIPNSVKSVGEHCFRNCFELITAHIGDGVTDLGGSAFASCNKLKIIKIGNQVQKIKELAFQDCYLLDSIFIPNSVQTIESTAFIQCTNLKKAHIGTGIKSIGMSAFYQCYNFKELYIDAVVPPTTNYSFWETGLEKIYVPCNSVDAYKNWGYTIIGVGGDCDTPPEPENSTFWNMSDAAFNSLGTITSTKTVDGLTIYATSSKSVVIDESAQAIDGLSFTHRLKFGGTGASDARLLSFKVDGKCDIDIYLMSASGSADRTLNVDKGSYGNSLTTIPAYSSGVSKSTVHYTGGATTIYLYSPSSGVNIYAIRLTSESTPQPSTYTVSVSSANTSMGTVSGSGTYEEGATATVTATPKSGYKFTRWSNGITTNPYSFTVTSNVSLTAYFEQSSTPEPESSTFWNMSDAAFNSLGTVISNKTINGLTIYATSSKNVVIDASIQEVDGLSFTHRLKLNGTGASDARMLSFNVNGKCEIDVYLKSGSGSEDRTINVDKGNFGSSLTSIPALGASISKGTIHYTGNATTIYLYSPSNGVNIYAIRVTYGDGSEDFENSYVQEEHAQKILRDGQILILRGDKTYTLTGQEVK